MESTSNHNILWSRDGRTHYILCGLTGAECRYHVSTLADGTDDETIEDLIMPCSTFPTRNSRPTRRPETESEKRSTLTSAIVTVDQMEGEFPIFRIEFTNGKGETFRGTWDSRRPLLSANSKLRKGFKRFRAIGLAMAPWKFAGKGNLCGAASAGCIDACNGLWAGMNVTPSTRFALIGRARLYMEFRALFLRKLREELANFERLCIRTGRVPAVRLNVSTDIPWERVAPGLFAEFRRIRFYDYSAYSADNRAALPANYQLCHSWKESTTFAYVESTIRAGRNIVVPFDSAYAPSRGLFGALPAEVVFVCHETGRSIRVRVRNGDKHDFRFRETDGAGVCIGLHGKSGRGKVTAAVESGFMRHHAEGSTLRRKTIHVGIVTVEC